jgi:hypothetical protein
MTKEELILKRNQKLKIFVKSKREVISVSHIEK